MLRKLGRLGEICLFELKHPSAMEYVLCAESEEELIDWMESLLLEIFREQFTVAASPSAVAVKGNASQRAAAEERERTMKRDLSMRYV